MNPDLNSSPLTSAQSWIVENISSLISSNLDDENDCTLTMPNENRSSKLSLSNSDDNSSPEVARTLAVADEHFALGSERLGKRPFSPELIFPEDTANAIDNCEQLQMFYNNNKLFSQMNQNVSVWAPGATYFIKTLSVNLDSLIAGVNIEIYDLEHEANYFPGRCSAHFWDKLR